MTHRLDHCRILFIGSALALFFGGTLSQLHIPLAEWDHVILSAAEDWSLGIPRAWRFDHPPLYPAVLSVVFSVFGPGAAVARWVNIAWVLLTAVGVYRFAAAWEGRDAALWALILYLISPGSIQGVASLDMADTSLLPLVFLLTAAAVRHLTLQPTFARTWILGGCMGMCMWSKITSTIALMGALGTGFAVLWLLGERKGMGRLGVGLVAAILIGLATYLASSFFILGGWWGTESFYFPLKAAHAAVMDRGESGGASAAVSILYSMARIVVWFSPYVLLVFMAAIGSCAKAPFRGASDENRFFLWIAIAAAAYFLAHMVIGGTNWGFPRYHVAVFPILCVLAGRFLADSVSGWDSRDRVRVAGAVGTTVILVGVLTRDPLLLLNIQLKQMILEQAGHGEMLSQALAVFLPLYGIPLLTAFFALRPWKPGAKGKALGGFLTIGVFTTILLLDVQQLTAPYRTTVQYGAAGKEQLLRCVRANLSDGDHVLSTPEFIYELRDFNVPAVDWNELRSPERLHRFVLRYAPAAVIGGLTVSTLDQLAWMFGPETKIHLGAYRFHRIGTYCVWLRERAEIAPGSAAVSAEASTAAARFESRRN